MTTRISSLLLLLLLALPAVSSAQSGYIEVTAPGNRQLKMAVDAPRSLDAAPNADAAKELSDVIAFDMNMSGNVTAEAKGPSPIPGDITSAEPDFAPWQAAGYDLLVRS